MNMSCVSTQKEGMELDSAENGAKGQKLGL